MPRDRVALAVATIVFTVFALSLGDAVIKSISVSVPLFQLFIARSALALPVLAIAVGLSRSRLSLGTSELLWSLLRSLMLVAMWLFYYASLPHVALSVAAAVYYTLPLFITLFAGAFLGERVGVSGWAAVLIGFVGVILILRPDTDAFNRASILPLVAAVFYALSMILTRCRCRNVPPLVLSLALNVAFVGVGALGLGLSVLGFTGSDVVGGALFAEPVAMDGRTWGVMGLLAVIILIGSIGTAIAYQNAPASLVSTFDFSYLAFAGVWGWVFFAETPGAMAAVGMALIVLPGLMAVRHSAV